MNIGGLPDRPGGCEAAGKVEIAADVVRPSAGPGPARTSRLRFPAIVGGGFWALVAKLVSQILAAFIALASTVWLHERYGHLDWLQVTRNSAFVLVAIISMVLVLVMLWLATEMAALDPWTMHASQVAAAALGYFGALLFMKKSVIGLMPGVSAEPVEAGKTDKPSDDQTASILLEVHTRP